MREDDRRATYSEEGIVAMLFSYAERRDFLRGQTGVEPLVMGLIRDMTSRFEVSARNGDQWEEAIFAGYSHWRNIRVWGGGRLEADLENRTLDLYLPSRTGEGSQIPNDQLS